MRPLRSVAAKLMLATAIFIGVPFLVYHQFEAADEEKTEILLRAIREQSKAVALALTPSLRTLTPQSFGELKKRIERFGGMSLNLKVLLRPANIADKSEFFYIASLPALPADYRESELANFKESGILDRLDESCTKDELLTHRYVNPAGEREVVTSVFPVQATSGCWIVITSNLASHFGGAAIDRPFWSRFPVQFSLAIYFCMAAIVLALLIELRRNLLQFARLARRIRRRGDSPASFSAANRIPELEGVAVEFDAMVGSLKNTAQAIRSTAAETAHAMKTPLGVLSQALEPLKRRVAVGDERAERSVERIELAIERLRKIVETNRRLEESTAASLDPEIERLDLGAFIAGLIDEIGAGLDVPIDYTPPSRPVRVRGNEDLIDAAVSNLIENAAGFSPAGAAIDVAVDADGRFGRITVRDHGPGAAPGDLERMFERNFSRRRREQPDRHYGLGLWIVRRNAVALGGAAVAENAPSGGLCVTVSLPLDD